jgi:ATP-binding cassette subfamily F protein 3
VAFVQFTRVSLAFGDRDILKDVGLNLASGSRAGLAGINGSGKSTLMKVIAGKLLPDSGERATQRGCRISYLPQSGAAHHGRSLRDEAETAYDNIAALLRRMEAIGRTLEGAREDNSRTASLLEEFQKLQESVENSGYYNRDQTISAALSGLGFSPADLNRQVEEFSGGWQMRIALAKTLLESPDILLLDEPTNYLDIEARSWLEQWLRNFTGGYLVVSHDRYFLDVTVNEVYELFQGRLKRYAGNYSDYERIRQAELDSLLKRYAAQQEEIARSEDLIRRFRYKASKAAMAQERIKKLEKMERIEIPETLKKISITLPAPPRSGRVAVTLEGLGKSYGERPVIAGLDLLLEAGERLVVAGRNGAGKTTLLRILAGEDQDFTGSLSYGAGIRPGYFSQDAAETLGTADSRQTLDFLESEAPTELIPRLRDMLGAFLFRGDDVYKPLSVLSGGEKSRLALLRMLLKPMNLLILDEPTNHLDLQSKDMLLDALKAYGGTIIFVSHDRAFMEALSTKTLELSPRGPEQAAGARLFYGNYAYYLDRLAREDGAASKGGSSGLAERVRSLAPASRPSNQREGQAAPLPAGEGGPAIRSRTPGSEGQWRPGQGGHSPGTLTAMPRNAPPDPAGPEGAPKTAGERREAEKQKQTVLRRIRREEAEILRTLEALEAEKAALEAELSQPAVYSDNEKARTVKARLDRTTIEIEKQILAWEAKAEELARVEG